MIVRDVFGTRCVRAIAKELIRPSYATAASRTWTQRRSNQHVVRSQRPFRLAIVGSGPAGFYCAYKVMSRIQDAVVDMYEQLPVPFGLVRFGVAPDHPEVKVWTRQITALQVQAVADIPCYRRTARTDSQKWHHLPASTSSGM